MFSKLGRIALLATFLTMTVSGVAYAGEETPTDRVRAIGEITSIDRTGNNFTLHTRAGEDKGVHVTGSTEYRSPGGEIEGFDDLEVGMHALVVGVERGDGVIVASVVAAVRGGDRPDVIKAHGKVAAVDLSASTLTIETQDGRALEFKVVERTKFRSRSGEINGLGDIEVGMAALAAGVETEDEGLIALLVAAGNPGDIPQNAFRTTGEITSVIPGQGTFTLKDDDGAEITFGTSDRTRFRSRDGSVSNIHDLKRGMHALVVGVQPEEGNPQALMVAVFNPQDRPGGHADVRAAGKITAIGSQSFTIETREGASKTFLVNGSTIFKSRDGSINGLGDLEVGMGAIVGAKETGDGGLLAVWVGAGHLPNRSHEGQRPQGVRPETAPRDGEGEAPLAG